MAKSKIYTKKGDQGKTTLVTGKKVSKTHPRLEAYGAVDELNSLVGLSLAYIKPDDKAGELKIKLTEIQNLLFNLGSQLSCDDEETKKKLPSISEANTESLEDSIDSMEEILPPLKNFILPGGLPAAATLQLARTVCRKSERLILKIQDNGESIESNILSYINRLSDFFFVAARFYNHSNGATETIWKSKT